MDKRKRFRHLDAYQRDRLEALLRTDHTRAAIARVLKVDRSTISREVNRRQRKNGVYDAATAEHKASIKRLNSKYRGMKIESSPVLRELVIAGLKEHRSPDEIAGRLKRETGLVLGKNAIYKWLYSPFAQQYCRYLCTRRYQKKLQKRKTRRAMIPARIPLFMRPDGPQYVHVQGDAVLSPKRAETKAAAFVVCEEQSKLLAGRKVPNLRPKTIARAAADITKTELRLDTITLDNGQENRDHQQMGAPTYFCDPHAPWQKPHVEVNIGLLRRWFVPKRTDWRTVSAEKFQYYLRVLNSKYRKSLGYRSAYEVAQERGIIKTLLE